MRHHLWESIAKILLIYRGVFRRIAVFHRQIELFYRLGVKGV